LQDFIEFLTTNLLRMLVMYDFAVQTGK